MFLQGMPDVHSPNVGFPPKERPVVLKDGIAKKTTAKIAAMPMIDTAIVVWNWFTKSPFEEKWERPVFKHY